MAMPKKSAAVRKKPGVAPEAPVAPVVPPVIDPAHDEVRQAAQLPAEPALQQGGIVAVVAAVLAAVVAFGVPLTVDERYSLLTLVGLVAPLVAGWRIRSRVHSPRAVGRRP